MADQLAPLQIWGLWAMGGTLALLIAFAGLRGRIAIERGWGGMTLQRFSGFERACHWLLALSFLVLAATGLATLYHAQLGPLVGTERLAGALALARPLHDAAAFVFTLSLAVAFLVWLRHAIPGWRDAVWLAKAGGMLIKGSTPPARMFNAGQKIFFWLVVLGGIGLVLTGGALLSPYRTGLVSKTFGLLAGLGVQLPTETANLTPLQEVQYARLWHGALALALSCVVLVHAFMRTLGIQGALSAMTSGRIDVNMARQQHSLWAERELQRLEAELPAATATPAE